MNLPDRDSLGRFFDPKKFKPALDKIGRWINAHAGRKPSKKSTASKPSAPSHAMSDTPTAETPSTETPPPAAAAESTPPPASSSAGNGAAGSATPDFSDIAAVLKEKPSALSPEDALETIEASGKEGTPTAETIIGIIQTALVLIGDDEGILTETEKMILRGPLDRVLKKYKIGDDVMPPEVDLAFALAGLVIVRLKKPKTATFAAKCRAWIVGMWFNQKGRTLAAKIDREASAR